jgi:hypothetical protein
MFLTIILLGLNLLKTLGSIEINIIKLFTIFKIIKKYIDSSYTEFVFRINTNNRN